MTTLRIGLIVNPLAGIGGKLALKGSDGEEVRALAAKAAPGQLTASMLRVQRALAYLGAVDVDVEILSCSGPMGQQVLDESGLDYQLIELELKEQSTAEDTRKAVHCMLATGIDIIVFAGGDGTARDIYDVVGDNFPVLGIPAGVKMHSGVFAVSPEAAGELLRELSRGGLVGLSRQEVRDIDEEAFRRDTVRSRFYGEMQVPGEGRYLQHTKVGGREDPGLVAADIAAGIVEDMEEGCTYLIGPGSTTAAIMEALGLPNTLLGVDAVRSGELILSDANEFQLLELLADTSRPDLAHVLLGL